MRAIILAAGRGKRLAGFNPDGRPKCLIEIGGKSLLARQLESLLACGIEATDIVVGYEEERIRASVEEMTARPDVDFHHNPRFEQGSVISLWAAHDVLESGSPVLILDADVLSHPAILQRLIKSDIDNCLLLDRNFEKGEEPVKVAMRENTIVEFSKRLPESLEFDTIGESVGFFRLGPDCAVQLAERCARFDAEGLAEAPHEDALRAEMLDQPDRFGCEDITGLPWIEIDFAKDVEKAGDNILPAIRKEYPGY
jgi:choline kinase